MWRKCIPAASAVAVPFGVVAGCDFQGRKTQLRSEDYPLARHSHGKTRVRVLKVRRGVDGVHSVSEYKVATTLFSPDYERVFTKGVNAALVATDTQKNTVYALAKRTEAKTPEACQARRMAMGHELALGVTICSLIKARALLVIASWPGVRASIVEGAGGGAGAPRPGGAPSPRLTMQLMDPLGSLVGMKTSSSNLVSGAPRLSSNLAGR